MEIGLQFCFTIVRHVGHFSSPLVLCCVLFWVGGFVCFLDGELVLISF